MSYSNMLLTFNLSFFFVFFPVIVTTEHAACWEGWLEHSQRDAVLINVSSQTKEWWHLRVVHITFYNDKSLGKTTKYNNKKLLYGALLATHWVRPLLFITPELRHAYSSSERCVRTMQTPHLKTWHFSPSSKLWHLKTRSYIPLQRVLLNYLTGMLGLRTQHDIILIMIKKGETARAV